LAASGDVCGQDSQGRISADLPVEFPARVQMVVNLKTAKTLDFAIPSTLLVRADEAVE
jgi:putative ABC transport system substrate-binding protein